MVSVEDLKALAIVAGRGALDVGLELASLRVEVKLVREENERLRAEVDRLRKEAKGDEQRGG